MYLLTYLEHLDKFDQLLQKKQTGPPKKIAKNLNISVRAFHEFKDQLIYEFGFTSGFGKKQVNNSCIMGYEQCGVMMCPVFGHQTYCSTQYSPICLAHDDCH